MGLKDDLRTANEKLDKIYEIITGNGSPEDGLVFKVAQHGRFVQFWEKFWGWILSAAIGVPFAVLAFWATH